MEEKAIVLVPRKVPQLVGNWRIGEYFEMLRVAQVWMENQGLVMGPVPTPEGENNLPEDEE